jgi:uncharacterized protein (TIGR00730 family)
VKSVCVFCGSSAGDRAIYRQTAAAMGEALALRGLTLIYGGGKVGLMGVVADAALAAGGDVVGVIPGFLAAKELAHAGLSMLHIVDSMHERKARMAELADAFVAMPGGFGTLEEFCEVLTWAQLGLHAKPHGLLNIAGYYDSLLTLFDRAVEDGFLGQSYRALILEGHDPSLLLDQLAAYRPRPRDKWLEGALQT